MEEPTAITIEFLRARLLSERSISRAATERANELAKRVVELEEQLKIVTLQRKKAGRAASRVLAILESHVVGDLSEEYYSGSDDEDGIPIESKESSHSMKEEGESLKTSRTRINEAELSGLELQASPLTGRSLSWKSCGSSNALETKKRISQSRRLNSPDSFAGPATKQHLGKSCCPMKQKETRSAADEERNHPRLLEVQENGIISSSRDVDSFEKSLPEILKGDVGDEEVKVSLEVLAPNSLEDQGKETNGGLFFNGNVRDSDMDRALEHQAQLIGRYEAEESAQREWEEKFGESNRRTPDYCEPGNQSDVTEESDEVKGEQKDEVKEQTTESVDAINPHGQGVKLGGDQVWHGEAMGKTVPNGILPSHFNNVYSQDQQGNSSIVNKSNTSMPEFSFPGKEKPESESKRKQKQELSENSLWHTPLSHSVEHQAAQKVSSNVDSSLCKGESQGIQNELQASGHHGTASGLGGVLEALQLAKLSLNHKLSSLPLPTQSRPMERDRETPVFAIEGGDAVETPNKYSGLFRVPSSSRLIAAAAHTKFPGTYPDSRSSMMRHYPSASVGVSGDYHNNLEIPVTPQYEVTTHQMNMLGNYPDSSSSLTRSYPSKEVGFPADHRANLEMPTSSQLEATNIQRNLLRTYPDSRSSMMRYYTSSDAAKNHGNSDMGLGISNHRSLIDPYMNIGINHSAYSRYTYPSYADHTSRMPTSDEFLRPYTSMGSRMPAGDSNSAYDGQFRWNMDQDHR